MDEPNGGISPTTAGWMLGILAVLGVGFYVFAVVLEQKSPDPLYDENDMSKHTSSELQASPDLWKKKAPVETPLQEAPSVAPAPRRRATTSPET